METNEYGGNMELRKVIKFGRATYSITLPKKWVTEQNLKKGDVVRVEQMAPGHLEISPNETDKEVEVRTIDISADEKSPTDIYREVIAAYVKNYTIINIKGDVKGKIKELRERLQQLIGLEIMEVGPTKIVAKSFLDVTQTKVEHTIKRIYYIIKSMSDEFKVLLKNGGSAEEILEMDEEVNRNAFFTMKFLFKSLEKPDLASKLGMKTYEMFLLWGLVQILENIADKIKMMAELVASEDVLRKTHATNDFLKLYEEVEEHGRIAMEQFFKRSKEKVHSIFAEEKRIEIECNEFLKGHKLGWTPLLIDHLKDINTYVRAIGEIIIDFE